IRDLIVTGVQTCALPISNHAGHERRTGTGHDAPIRPEHGTREVHVRPGMAKPDASHTGTVPGAPSTLKPTRRVVRPTPENAQARSEERRVGKERKTRWGT